MFEGNVSTSYFTERVMKLYNQFGNRTKSQVSYDNELARELRGLKEFISP
jgi:hypothetical protein